MKKFVFLLVVLIVCFLWFFSGGSRSSFKLDYKLAKRDLGEFVKEPHSMGSKRQSRLADFVFNRLVADKLEARIQSFDAQVPIRKDQDGYGRAGNYKRTVKGYNVFGYLKMDKPSECIQMVGSHYDTKHIPGLRYVGANDSASSSALLFQLASHFKKNLGGLG